MARAKIWYHDSEMTGNVFQGRRGTWVGGNGLYRVFRA